MLAADEIFALPPTEVAAHPSDDPHHEMYLMRGDIRATVDRLKPKESSSHALSQMLVGAC
jgi:hypothetical protein